MRLPHRTETDFEEVKAYVIECHRNNGHEVATHVFPGTCRLTDNSERRPIERESQSGPRWNRSSHLEWEILAVWIFAVFSFAALLFCLYVISEKCRAEPLF